MKIKSISIEYFRGLNDVDIQEFDEHVNLFVGVNGAGKSSILDAMSLVFSWYTARMLSAKGRGRDIPKDDISLHSPNGCTIELGIGNDNIWKLYRSLKYYKMDKSDLSSMNQVVFQLRENLDNVPGSSIPIVAHYGVNRVIPNKYPRLPRGKNLYSQLDVYKNALSGGQLFSDFFNWFRLSEDYENEQYKENKLYRDHGLEAVRRCMSIVMPEYSNMKVSRRPLALTMKKGDETFRLNQLSDGEKCYISLVCDIARRLAIANPNGDPLSGEGIILIDEIDLHLHPKWQQTVVSRLVKTFPNCQFFITTHSPIVASDVDGKVFGIKNGEIVPQRTFGKLSSSILSSVFDVSMARSLFVQSIIDSAYDAISERNDAVFVQRFDELVKILGADDSDVIGLKIEKLRRDKLVCK
ncbi:MULTISPECIES: AAA family ATPase [Butyricimonas]|uniref:AAA family ATPase n=1 Tax=Butyricimonas TaxID=574697 RepID=UPI0007FB371A|nr:MULTISPECIES: AAA family ATPase [Butyricimonas]